MVENLTIRRRSSRSLKKRNMVISRCFSGTDLQRNAPRFVTHVEKFYRHAFIAIAVVVYSFWLCEIAFPCSVQWQYLPQQYFLSPSSFFSLGEVQNLGTQ